MVHCVHSFSHNRPRAYINVTHRTRTISQTTPCVCAVQQVPCLLIRQNIELDVPSNGCQVYVKHYLPLEVALGLQNYVVARMLLTAGCSVVSRHYTCVCDSEDHGPPLDDLPWLRLHAEAFDYIRNEPSELSWLVSFLRNPVGLREICRRCIRRRLRAPLATTIRKLQHIPTVLKDYIAMNDM